MNIKRAIRGSRNDRKAQKRNSCAAIKSIFVARLNLKFGAVPVCQRAVFGIEAVLNRT